MHFLRISDNHCLYNFDSLMVASTTSMLPNCFLYKKYKLVYINKQGKRKISEKPIKLHVDVDDNLLCTG